MEEAGNRPGGELGDIERVLARVEDIRVEELTRSELPNVEEVFSDDPIEDELDAPLQFQIVAGSQSRNMPLCLCAAHIESNNCRFRRSDRCTPWCLHTLNPVRVFYLTVMARAVAEFWNKVPSDIFSRADLLFVPHTFY